MNDWTKKQITPFNFYCQHILPIVYDESLSYYEVLCKIQVKLNEVIDNQNQLNEAFTNLLKWIDTQLENYVDDKLQGWLDDGTLENMIMSLGHIIRYVNTTNDMKTIENLVENQIIKTLGYYDVNDGGDALFIIRKNIPNKFYVALNNGMYAEMIYRDFLDVVKAGVPKDNDEDIYPSLSKILKYQRLKFQCGKYTLKTSLPIETRQLWICDTLSNYDNQANILLIGTQTNISINQQKSTFKGITFSTHDNLANTAEVGIIITQPLIKFYNCNFYYFKNYGVKFNANTWLCEFDKCRIEHNGTGVRTNNNSNFCMFSKCYIHANNIGVDVYGTTENGGSPNVQFIECDIEDNNNYGINIRGSINNEVFINNCYFEHHKGFAIFGSNVQENPTKGAKFLGVSNTRFYGGSETTGLIYLYWYNKVTFTNCVIETFNNENEFSMINIGINTDYVVTNGVEYSGLTEKIKSFNDPLKIKSNDVTTSNSTTNSDMPKNAGAGAICFTGNKQKITDLKIFDGRYWRNNDGTIVGQ